MKDVSFKFLLLLQVFLLLGHGYLYSGEQGGKKVKVLLAGDSTMQDVNHEKNTDWGWGQVLPRFFNEKVEILNFAKGGRSSRTFIEEGRWDKLMAKADEGSYIFIQFGHNDASQKKPDRYTSPEDYRKYLTKVVNEVKSKGATPVLVTPVSRRKFKKGVFSDSHGVYPDIVKEVARTENVLLIDLQAKSATAIAEQGDEKSKKWFNYVPAGTNPIVPDGKSDDTHFSEEGAIKMASLVLEGMRELNLKELIRNLK